MQKKSKKGKIDKNICQMHYKRNHKLFDTLSSKFGKPLHLMTICRGLVVQPLYINCFVYP